MMVVVWMVVVALKLAPAYSSNDNDEGTHCGGASSLLWFCVCVCMYM